MSFRSNLQTARTKKTMIQARRTPIRSPLEYQEGAGIIEEAFAEETGPIAVVRRDEYTDVGLNKLRAWYQSGTTIEFPITNFEISIEAASNPIKTIGRIMLKRNHRKIAPPIAVDRLLKSVEKNSATLKNTIPRSMVTPMKIP